MVPIPAESHYFPSVGRCLEGDTPLISWKEAFRALFARPSPIRPGTPSSDSHLKVFLSDNVTLRLLQRPYNPTLTPSSETKLAFETRTSAVNVTPTESASYDIRQLKDDSLWLSKETKIDEVSALRIVLLEWRSRPSARLLSGFSDEEAASLHDTAGASVFASSLFLPRAPIAMGSVKSHELDIKDFDTTPTRRRRLLQQYLQDRRYILKLSEYLLRDGLSVSETLDEHNSGPAQWRAMIGQQILRSLSSRDVAGKGPSNPVEDCVTALQARIDGLENGSHWPGNAEQPILEMDWGTNLIAEMIHILQILFLVIDAAETPCGKRPFLAWFRLMDTYAFFDTFAPPHDPAGKLIMAFRSLVTTVSVAILKFPLSIDHFLVADDDQAFSEKADTPFFADPTVFAEAYRIFLAAANAGLLTASPAVFGWSIILQAMRSHTQVRQEASNRRRLEELGNSVDVENSETDAGDSPATERGSRSDFRRRDGERQSSEETGIYDGVMEELMDNDADEDPIEYLAKCALFGSQMFDVLSGIATGLCNLSGAMFDSGAEAETRMRLVLLELIRASLNSVEYSEDVLSASLSVITAGESYWDFADRVAALRQGRSPSSSTHDIATVFLSDDAQLVPRLLNKAYERYPYEALPFLRLVRALATSQVGIDMEPPVVLSMLQHMSCFTHLLPPGFRSYETIREEENSNQVVLVADLDLFAHSQTNGQLLLRGQDDSQALVLIKDPMIGDGITIPEGTRGRIVSDPPHTAAQWDYAHSGLRYLSHVLQCVLPGSNIVDTATGSRPDADLVTEIVGVWTNILTVATAEQARELLLSETRGGNGRMKDIASIVLEIFETELQSGQLLPGNTESTELLITCVQFLYALSRILPNRVWSFLDRSALLAIDGSGGRLGSFVAGVEMVTGHFDFLTSCLRLFETLIDQAITRSVRRRVGLQHSVGRGADLDGVEYVSTASEKVVSNVLLACAQTMMDAVESSSTWRFTVADEKLGLQTRILAIFDRILTHTRGGHPSEEVDSAQDADGLGSTSNYLIEVFLGSLDSSSIHPLLRVFSEGLDTPDTTIFMGTLRAKTDLVRGALQLSITLIRIRDLMHMPPSQLDGQLLRAAPLLARLYALDPCYRMRVVQLLQALTVAAAASQEQPPALLGHLGSESAKNFLVVLSQLDMTQTDEELERAIWGMFSAVVSGRQQWLSVYLLTGQTPRDNLKSGGGASCTPKRPLTKPIIVKALDSVTDLRRMPHGRATVLLEFIVRVYDNCPWATSEIKKHATFLRVITDFVGGLSSDVELKSPSNSVEAANKIRLASLVAQVLAMYLHQSRQNGDDTLAKKMLPQLQWLSDNAVQVPSYNISLHANLRRTFEERLSPCQLSSLKHDEFQRQDFGPEYFYDVDLARQMLGSERNWAAFKMEGELKRANVNLSVVEAQVLLLHRCKPLIVELCSSLLPQDIQFQSMIASTVHNCLVANATTNLPEPIFDQLMRVRNDLAFFLLQQLTQSRSRDSKVLTVLKRIWDNIRTSNTDFELSLSSGNASHYRSMLKILFLALRAHLPDPSLPHPARSVRPQPDKSQTLTDLASRQTILSILELVVARGFRHLSAAAHDQPPTSTPEDIALLIAILQTALQIPGIEPHHPSITRLFIDHDTARTATTLFSWADQLAIDHDPIYGELSILMLVELTRLPTLAQHIAQERLLSRLLSAKLMQHYTHSGGVSSPRLHTIWTRGLLALCLNLLDIIGAPIATEITSFLNTCSPQLSLAAHAFRPHPPSIMSTSPAGATSPIGLTAPKGTTTKVLINPITLPLASEAHTLSILSRILTTFGLEASRSAVIVGLVPDLAWDATLVRDDIESLLAGGRRGLLRARIVPSTEVERQMEKMPPRDANSGAVSALEERVVGELEAVVGILAGSS